MRIPELGTIARHVGVLTAAAVWVACSAPAVQPSQAPSATPAASALPSAGATPTEPVGATAEPTGTPAASRAVEAPDDILPPWSIVTVIVDALQLRAEPGLSAPVIGTAQAGQRYQVAYEFGPWGVDGLDWYRLATGGDSVIWAAVGSGAERYLEVVPPTCPVGDPDLAAVVRMNDWDRLACFGDRSLTFEGTYACQGCGGTAVGEFEPMWLAYPVNADLLWPDYRSRTGYLEMRIPPDSEVARPEQGSIVRVTGHFSDAASSNCTISVFDGEQAMSLHSRTAELLCRERFVIDAVDVIGTDPTFSAP